MSVFGGLPHEPVRLVGHCSVSRFAPTNALAHICEPVRDWLGRYCIHMRRTNLVLDEQLLQEATRVLAARTYSAAVNAALEEVIRVRKIRSIPGFFQSGIWQGELPEMREDRRARRPRSR